jgi:hypothetical protein|tara:strand:- start:607 stop:852 length:246 start_codon:yes stop_codon:yes gene_type:complete
MKDGTILDWITELKTQQKESNEVLKSILTELIKINKSLPVVKDLIEESEILDERQKDLEIKSLMAKQQLLRNQKRSNENNK